MTSIGNEREDGKRRISVFDFDGTLTRRDTLLLFARHALGRHAAHLAILRTLPHILAWKLGLITNSKAKEKLFGHMFGGMPYADFKAYGESFADIVDRNMRKQGCGALEMAIMRGEETVIDSASVEEWILPWARRHGVSRVLATRPEVADGRLTGRFATPNCVGAEKVNRLRRIIADSDSVYISAYGDSGGDAQLLEYADEPHLLKRRPRKDIRVAIWFLAVTLLLAIAAMTAWNKYITSPPYVDPTRFPVRGIDVSAHNGMMNLDAAAEAGIEFIFLKATEGTDFRDPNFALNYLKAGHAGMKRGAYHFFRFDSDGTSQAQNLLKALRGRPLELGIAIDVEDHGNPSGIPFDSITTRLQDMTDYLNLKGYRVTFYSNEAGYSKYIYPAFRGFPIWICSFSEDTASEPFTYWQYNHRGQVPGIIGDVDLNVFGGDREAWQNHLRETAK